MSMSDIEKKIHEGIEAILSESGLASKDTEVNFKFNPQQLDYALRAGSGFCRFDKETGRTSLNMLQAATGTGKTIGYLVPLMLFAAYAGKRVAVSTYTRHLQRQILQKDAVSVARWVQQVTGKTLSIARRLGKQNYISAFECARLIDSLRSEDQRKHKETIAFVEELMEWAEEAGNEGRLINSGLIDDFMDERCVDTLPDGLSYKSLCLNPSSSNEESQTYLNDVGVSKKADVLIVNHSLMMLNANRWASILDDKDLRQIAVAVFDEADRLESVAASMLSADVALHRLKRIGSEVSSQFANPAIAETCNALHDYVMQEKVSTEEARPIFQTETLANLINLTLRAALPVTEKWVPGSDLLPADEVFNRLMSEFVDEINDLNSVRTALVDEKNSAILSWSPVKRYPSLRIGLPSPGKLISRMWNLPKAGCDENRPLRGYLDAALFTSATLTVPGKVVPDAFDDFANSIGIIRYAPRGQNAAVHNVQLDLYATYQPRDFGKMTFVLADPQINDPTARQNDEETTLSDPEWLAYCATMILSAKKAGGRVLVLTQSWRDTIALGRLLEGTEGLLLHGRGEPLRSVIAQYKQDAGAVMISPGAWEGVDLPGLMDNLVITRIPFPPPNKASEEMLRIHLLSKGFDKKRIESVQAGKRVIETRRKLEQGIGRGIRASTDDVRIWIADPRFPYPEGISLDPLFMAAPVRLNRTALLSCIPRRFLQRTYPDAKICLRDGSVYSPIRG